MATNKQKSEEVVIPSYLKFSKVIVWLMYFWVLIGVIALTLRVFLLAFSANPASGFTEFVYRVSGDYLHPFRGIFPSRTIGETGYLDTAAIFAIVMYLFLAWGFKALIDYIQNKIDISTAEQKQALEQAERARLAEARAKGKSATKKKA